MQAPNPQHPRSLNHGSATTDNKPYFTLEYYTHNLPYFTLEYLVYALMYFRAKCLLKVIFLLIRIWNIVVMKKKGLHFFLTLETTKIY